MDIVAGRLAPFHADEANPDDYYKKCRRFSGECMKRLDCTSFQTKKLKCSKGSSTPVTSSNAWGKDLAARRHFRHRSMEPVAHAEKGIRSHWRIPSGTVVASRLARLHHPNFPKFPESHLTNWWRAIGWRQVQPGRSGGGNRRDGHDKLLPGCCECAVDCKRMAKL